MDWNCPVCGEEPDLSCRCLRGDSICANKHEWYYCVACLKKLMQNRSTSAVVRLLKPISENMKTQHYLVRSLQHHVVATVAMDIAGGYFNDADRFTISGQFNNYFESTTPEKYEYETKQLEAKSKAARAAAKAERDKDDDDL